MWDRRSIRLGNQDGAPMIQKLINFLPWWLLIILWILIEGT